MAEARNFTYLCWVLPNVYRLSDWLGGVPRAATRTSRFQRLAA